jgi:hypothetical protein
MADYGCARSIPTGLGRVNTLASAAQPACLARSAIRRMAKANPKCRLVLQMTRARCFAEPSAIKRDEIASRQLFALKQHSTGKLRIHDVKEMFEAMKDQA